MSRTLDRALGEFEKMPTVVGDPVVESGSNSDGEWTRWADGSQRCKSLALQDPNTASYSAQGNGYILNTNLEWTYPAAFIEAPGLGGKTSNPNTWIDSAGATSSTLAAFRLFTFSSAVSGNPPDLSGYFVAEGRYK